MASRAGTTAVPVSRRRLTRTSTAARQQGDDQARPARCSEQRGSDTPMAPLSSPRVFDHAGLDITFGLSWDCVTLNGHNVLA